ncbi:zona pellucida sperm-binding protein 3-like isoform 1-T1 [Pholidichthys leucotaenia]
MALVWHAALLLSLIAVTLVTAEMTVDCRSGYVTVVWKESRAHHDTSRFRLGNCEPTTLTPGEAVFSVDFSYCDFMQLVTGNKLIYANNLTYTSPPNSLIPSFTNQVKCQYERPKDWYPLLYEPAFQTYGVEDLVFHIGLMNADFSGPAESTNFSLGSMIPIMASVEQKNHQPLMLLLDECEAATTPDLRPGSKMYPIITNKGCLVDSKMSRSHFQPRWEMSEIRLSLQAFKMALGEEVFIHCSLVAWDPNGLDNTKKACHFVKDHGWELLDYPSYSSLCDCCESSCKSRSKRSPTSEYYGIKQKGILGPLTITT